MRKVSENRVALLELKNSRTCFKIKNIFNFTIRFSILFLNNMNIGVLTLSGYTHLPDCAGTKDHDSLLYQSFAHLNSQAPYQMFSSCSIQDFPFLGSLTWSCIGFFMIYKIPMLPASTFISVASIFG